MNQHSSHRGAPQTGGSQQDAPDFWRSRYALGLVVIGAAALYFLLTEHREHFFGALPFAILLACPLMHIFMHKGHGGHGGHGDHGSQGSAGAGQGGCCAPGQHAPAASDPSKPGEKS